MAEDLRWELAILATVHGFDQKLLRDYFEGEVPIPVGLETDSLMGDGRDPSQTLARLRRWVQLLDMAITPAMMRQALTADTDPEIAEALLRYYSRKKEPSDADRDKTDLVATFLYRYPRVSGQWESRGYGLDGTLTMPAFEIALVEILSDSEAPPLGEEEVHLLGQLDGLRTRTESMEDFDALLDSGMVEKARKLKRLLGASFYHPGVLSAIAPYNAAFGQRFDLLFRAEAEQIKKIARSIEERGGSIVGQVEGMDVTVELVDEMDVGEILKTDYTLSLDRFRRVSKLKRSLAGPARPLRASAAAAAVAPGRGRVPGGVSEPAHPELPMGPAHPAMLKVAAAREAALEETRLRSIEGSIRAFVRAANPRLREIVPMRHFNLLLTAAEADAFCADYLEEDSFRGDHARIYVRISAIVARLTTELEELRRQSSTHLAKPHAESLAVLLQTAKTAGENAEHVSSLAEQRGLPEKVIALEASLQKLRERAELAEKALAEFAGKAARL